MYDHIVLAVDGSDRARVAALRGLELARRFDATVDVVHVVPRRALDLTSGAGEVAALRERGEEALAAVEGDAGDHGLPVTTHLLEGRPSVELVDHVAETDASLLVMGRQGTTGLGRRLLGSVTERVLNRSDVPVLVDVERAPDAEIAYADVLVPTDGSENAEVAAPHAAAVGSRYGSTVHALSVVDIQAAAGPFGAGGLDKSFVERLEAEGQAATDSVRDLVGEAAPDVRVETAVVRSNSFDGVAPGITEYAEDHGIDLVVMGSHGRSSIGRGLLGSVASTLLRTVDVPVLVVRPQD